MTTPIGLERAREFFSPRSVVFVGASDRSGWSIAAFDNMRRYAPDVDVHLVNPSRPEVHGQPALASVADLPGPVDLAYLLVATERVPDIVDELAAKGVRNIAVLASGYADEGPAGLKLQQQLVAQACELDVCILGPNCNGFVNMAGGAVPYSAPIPRGVVPGPLGLVVQSGAMGNVIMAGAANRRLGISLSVATGNEAMISVTDVLEALIEDDTTEVIGLHLETIRERERFRALALEAARARKPIVALKTGRSAAGARSALAHTGGDAGDDEAINREFAELGIVRVRSLEVLLATAAAFVRIGPLRGRRMAIMSGSGGGCGILADRATDEGFDLPGFSPATQSALEGALPGQPNVQNPLDITGRVVLEPSRREAALEFLLAEQPPFDVVVIQTPLAQVAPKQPDAVLEGYRALGKLGRNSSTPVVILAGIEGTWRGWGEEQLAAEGLPCLGGMELGMAALGRLAWYHEATLVDFVVKNS